MSEEIPAFEVFEIEYSEDPSTEGFRNIQINQIVTLGDAYLKESSIGLTLTDTPFDSLFFAVKSEEMRVLHITDRLESVGVAIIAYDTFFSKERLANLYMFYIKPKYRGTYAASLLFDNVIAQAQLDDARYMVTATYSLIDDKTTEAFNKLFVRGGFTPLSPILLKEL